MNGLKYLLAVLLSLAGLFFVQTFALDAVNGIPGKSESNYFSSLGRIQAGIRRKPEIMLLGSSITGRLADEKDGFEGVANLGCDGGSAVDTLRAIESNFIPKAEVLIVECNNLTRGLQSFEGTVGEAIGGLSFRLGNRMPQLSSAARPSGFFYSLLMRFRLDPSKGPEGPRLDVRSSPFLVEEATQITNEDGELVTELARIINDLKDQGVRVLLVMYPPGVEGDSRNRKIAQNLSLSTNTPYWDLMNKLPEGSFELTDQVHMDRRSADRTLRAMLDEIGR